MACILACIDLSPVSNAVLDNAAELAQGLGLELVVLLVAAPDPDFVGYEAGPKSVRDQVAHHLKDDHTELRRRVEALAAKGVAARPLMTQGPAAEQIVKHAQSLGARIVVIGSHGHGKLYDLLVGSVADAVLRQSTIPVMMVPARV